MKLLLLMCVWGVAMAFAGCGGSDSGTERESLQDLRLLKLTLDGEPGPETAGLLTADKLGYFEEIGLSLATYTPMNPRRPIRYVNGGAVDVAVTHEPQVVLAREEGVPIVAIGSIVPEPTMAMIWLERSNIDDVSDLKGKTVAIPGAPFQEQFLKTVLSDSGVAPSDLKIKQFGYELVPGIISGRPLVPELIKGHVDAIFGGSWNVEGAAAELSGAEPVITRARDLGIPPYDELVVIARKDRVAKEPELFRRFMEAVNRGTAAAIEDPRIAAEAIVEADENKFDQEAIEAGLEDSLSLLSTDGQIDSEQTEQLIEWMYEQGMIQRTPAASSLLVDLEEQD